MDHMVLAPIVAMLADTLVVVAETVWVNAPEKAIGGTSPSFTCLIKD